MPTLEELSALARERGLSLPTTVVSDKPSRPIVIAHRGASGYLPEHTLESYGLAILLGADFIEPDLVMTRDGQLIARHDNLLDLTTDISTHPEFANRRTRKLVDGVELEGWFSEDFDLDELRTLRACERIPELRPQNARYSGRFSIPTLSDIIALVRQLEPLVGRRVGLYPETKHPSHFQRLGLAMETTLVALLHAAGYRGADAAVYLQSFEMANLRQLRGLTDLPLIQLLGEAHERPWDTALQGSDLTYGALTTSARLREIADYATGIGPDKQLVLPPDMAQPLDRKSPRSELVERAHACGLQVHPYTFRSENHFLPPDLRIGDQPTAYGDGAGEISRFLAAGVDGFFTDQPDVGIAVKQRFCV